MTSTNQKSAEVIKKRLPLHFLAQYMYDTT